MNEYKASKARDEARKLIQKERGILFSRTALVLSALLLVPVFAIFPVNAWNGASTISLLVALLVLSSVITYLLRRWLAKKPANSLWQYLRL